MAGRSDEVGEARNIARPATKFAISAYTAAARAHSCSVDAGGQGGDGGKRVRVRQGCR